MVSFSKLFKKLKYKLAEDGRRQDGRSSSGNDDERRQAGVEGNDAIRRSSYPHPDTEDAIEGEPGQERNDVNGTKVRRINPTPSILSVSHSDQPNSM